MIVSFVWPNCEFQNGKWGCEPKDAYFVGFTLDEAQKHFPDETFDKKDLLPSHATDYGSLFWFLIGADLSFRDRFSWHYPISQMWNGYSPFVFVGDKEINNLEELRTVDISHDASMANNYFITFEVFKRIILSHAPGAFKPDLSEDDWQKMYQEFLESRQGIGNYLLSKEAE